MEACEVVGLFVNKAVVSAEPNRRGNPGHSQLKSAQKSRLRAFSSPTRSVNQSSKFTERLGAIVSASRIPISSAFAGSSFALKKVTWLSGKPRYVHNRRFLWHILDIYTKWKRCFQPQQKPLGRTLHHFTNNIFRMAATDTTNLLLNN